MIDIYSKYDTDKNFEEGVIEINDDFEIFLQQIETILTTAKTEFLGDVFFGASLEEYIHTFSLNAQQLQFEITKMINTYCTLAGQFNYSVDVKFFKGSLRDIALIDIIIDGTKMFGVEVR